MHIFSILPTSAMATPAARLSPLCLMLVLMLGGCNHSDPAGLATNAPSGSADTLVDSAAATAPRKPIKPATSTAAPGLAGRNGELTNPDNPTMVFLYYDLAGIPPPFDQWVEQDSRVRNARPADKATQRASVKAAFAAGLAAVRGIGVIHLTMNADLSQYDPAYGEFTVGALSPGSAYTFQAQGQTVGLKFDNGLAAQTWRVPKDQAQAVIDKIGTDHLTVDTTLKIDKVLPGPGGGTIVTHIASWNLRNANNGTTLARVEVPVQ